MLGVARDGALCWTRLGRGLYVVHRPEVGSMFGMTGSGLYIEHGAGVGSILGMALRRPERALYRAWP